jgi:putative endonuclease
MSSGAEIDLFLRTDGPRGGVKSGRADARRGATYSRPPKAAAADLRRPALPRRFAAPPPCRFDVATVEGERIEWLRAAFDAS